MLAMVSDLNVDGYVDVLIKNLGNAIDNVDDQILYSAAKVFNGNVRSVTAVTKEFQMFFRDAFKGIFDSNYFNQAITPAQPALSYGLVYGAQACYYFYGFPFCASYARHAILEIFTLAELGLSAVDEAQAKTALAEHFGLPDYDAYVCTFICALQVYYSYNSSIAVFAYDTFLPTTVGPGFDDVNFSAKASDFVDVFADIFDSGVFIPNSAKIIRVGEMIEEVLGVEILGGVFGTKSRVYDPGGFDEISVVPWLMADAQVTRPAAPSIQNLVNPLPGASINKKVTGCTSDGRFDGDASKGYRTNENGTARPHKGVDLGDNSPVKSVEIGTPVHAAHSGKAMFARDPGGWGDYVRMHHPTLGGLRTLYGHLSSGTSGSEINAGDQIGRVGRSGISNPCIKTHLHFEIILPGRKRIDPQSVFTWPLER